MKYVSVALDKNIEDWDNYTRELNRVLPADAGIALDIGDDPVRHQDFCPFVAHLERAWKIRTTLLGPGYDCLRVRFDELWRCEEVVAVFVPNPQCGIYDWLRKPVRLVEVGYNVIIESPADFDLRWARRYARKPIELKIRKPPKRRTLAFGMAARREPQNCEGEKACIVGGKYYPCYHCIGGWNTPVYKYGEFPKNFFWAGRTKCFLKDCPLEDENGISRQI